MSQERKDPLLGTTIGQYEIQEEIGRGGMATVYSARQKSMNRIVAVKVLPRHLLHDPGFLERFQREVDVIARLEHPHILPIYDYGEADGVPYIAMRYLGGGSMAQMIRRGVPPLPEIEKPFSQIAQALDYAHQQGIIHRDLKPGNIMLDENGNAYLSDFGIARVMGSDLTGSAIIGTPAYMSPEQANGLPIDARSDIYALGIVLFELITGREPYQAETPMALLLKHINEPLPPVRDFREGVPAMVEGVIARATAKDPDERFTSAGELSRSLSDALRGKAVDLPPVSPAAPDTRPSAATAAAARRAGDTMQDLGPSTVHPSQVPHYTDPGTTTYPTGEFVPSGGGGGMRLLAGLFVVIVLVGVVGVGALLLSQAGGGGGAAAVPTPFRGADVVEAAAYTISMPTDWIPLNDFNDESDERRSYHVWRAADNSALVSLAFPRDAGFSIEAYHQAYYAPQAGLSLIDEAVAPDGTVRRSYRAEGYNGLASGQIDVFYMSRGGLAVVETYTSDRVAGDQSLIDRLQLVLDSLRVKAAASG